MKISIEDSKYIDIDTYIELVELEVDMLEQFSGKKPKKATLEDIDNFFK